MRTSFRVALTVFFSLCLVPALCLAQTRDANDKLLEEMKTVRASLDRLVLLMESFQRSQDAAVTLQQIQMLEKRLTTKEMQRDQLAEQEKKMGPEVAASAEFLRNADSGSLTLVTDASGDQRTELQNRLGEAIRNFDEIQGKRQSLDQEVVSLKSRIVAMEKHLEQAGR